MQMLSLSEAMDQVAMWHVLVWPFVEKRGWSCLDKCLGI